jgi:acetamidase/formamidase
MAHTKYAYSPDHSPIGTVQAHERFEVECIDTWSRCFRTPSDFTPDVRAVAGMYQWAVTGPIAVEGALPGDAIAVTIHDIRITGPGVAVYGEYASAEPADWWDDETGVEIFPVENGLLRFDAATTLSIRPLVGCLAVAPEGSAVHAKLQGTYGGNLDSRDICAGATLILPVSHPGAGLYFGDCKALVSDAEVVTAPECDAVVVVSAEPRPRPETMVWPRIETAEGLITLVSGRPLEWAARQAFRELLDWIAHDYDLPRSRAALLMGMVAHTGICQVSNTDYTAYCAIPRHILTPYVPPT